MRICLLTTQDLDVAVFPKGDWPCDPRPFVPEASWHVENLMGQDAAARTEELVGEGFDVFFNLCDGAADEKRPGIEVVQTLERLGAAFTGANSSFYEPTRIAMKEACARAGIPTPRYVMAETSDDVERAAEELTFPLFVKHHNSYASVSLSRASRVQTPAGLRRQARKIMSRHGAALVEEYVDGIECTVLVAENPEEPDAPTTYQPIQYRFPDGESFKHARIKWVDYHGMSASPVEDPELDRRLRDVAARFFVELGGRSYGRCDVRVDGDGTPWMLEVNPNCGLYFPETDYGSADLCLANDPAGHEGFTRQIIAAALARRAR